MAKLSPEEVTEIFGTQQPESAQAETTQARKLDPKEVEAMDGANYRDFWREVNNGIADVFSGVVGAPVDFLMWRTRKNIGEEMYDKIWSKEPILSSNYIKAWAKDTGLFYQPTEIEGDTLAKSIGKTVGTGASFLVPFGAATKGLAAAGEVQSVIGGIAQHIAKQSVASPITFMATDTAVNVMAGTGGFAARQLYPDSDSASIWGELLGGFSPAVLSGAGHALSKVSPSVWVVKKARDFANKTIEAFSPDGARIRVEKRLQEAAINPKEAVERMAQETIPEANLTPAQKSESRGLLAIEKAVIESSSTLKNQSDEQINSATKAIRESLETIGDRTPATATVETLEDAKKYILDMVDTRIRIAMQKVDERVADMSPKASRREMNAVAREELDGALTASRAQESQFWNAVPENIYVPTSSTKTKYQEALNSLAAAQRDDMPDIATELIGGKTAKIKNNVKELYGLRKSLLEEERIARSDGKYNKARVAGTIADAILDDLGAQRDNIQGVVGEKLRAAIDYSYDLNKRFHSGYVGKLLGTDRRGFPKIHDELTLEESIGAGGSMRRGVNSRALLEASDTPEMRSAVEDFLRDEFQRHAVKDGALNQSGAQTYLKKYRDVLEDYPKIKTQTNDAIRFNDASIHYQERADGLARALNDPKISRAAIFIKEPTEDAFKRLSKLPNPGESMEGLVRLSQRDETGKALKGLKTSFGNHLIEVATTRAETYTGDNILSGKKMLEALESGPEGAMARALFTPEELDRLSTIVSTAVKIEKAVTAKADAGILLDSPSLLVAYLSRLLGAAAGRHAAAALGSSGTVQIPGIASELALKLSKRAIKDPALKIVLDAVQDESLFTALLQNRTISSRVDALDMQSRLNTWLASLDYDGDKEPQSEP